MFRTQLSLDLANRVMTAGVAALVAAAFVLAEWRPSGAGRVALAVVVGALALSFMMAPRALVVEKGELRIERRLWAPLRVPLADIERAALLGSLGGGVLRLFGVGGFFGSYGLFRSTKLGRFRMYATHGGQAVLVTRKGGLLPLVITPDDVAGAIDAINPRPRG
jgi:uncharacterized membrane protein YfcA